MDSKIYCPCLVFSTFNGEWGIHLFETMRQTEVNFASFTRYRNSLLLLTALLVATVGVGQRFGNLVAVVLNVLINLTKFRIKSMNP